MSVRTIGLVVFAAGMICPAAWPQQPDAPQAVSGKVFLDANGNGVMDAGEQGVGGVRITDGKEFVVTGPDGAYMIQPAADPMFKYRPAQTITVCWPSGKWPTGRYWVRLADMKDPAAVNFGLREDKQSLPFMYLHHSDSHCRFPGGCDVFAEFVNGLGSEVKFVLDTGDTSFGESPQGQTFAVLTEAEKKFKIPFMHTIGNHDVVAPGKPEIEGHGAWTKDLGPMRWSFDYADVHFTGIDCYEEAVRPEVVEWLERDFKAQPKGKRIILSYHYPNPDGGKFHKLLKDYNVQLIHAGHNHASIYWNWHAPMVTVFDYKPLGDCNAVVVTDTGVYSGYYCLGDKGKPFTHGRRCPISWDTGVLLPAVTKLFGNVTKIENKPLAGAGEAIPFATTKAVIQTQIDPGSAKRVVMNVTGKAGALKIEFTGDHLAVDSATLRFDIKRPDKLLDLRVFVQKGMVSVWADKYFFIEKHLEADCTPGAVTLSAEGGAATIKTLTVSEVKPDASPDVQQGGYHNNGIGGPRRTPD
ncbi:MAG: metallophosphoesterase [Planctomycetaceae bacterium]|nr:metallophosphoesterase [Planctomycetaceae bacterium]